MKEDNDRVVGAINSLTDIVKAWMEHTKDINDLRDRINRLGKHTDL